MKILNLDKWNGTYCEIGQTNPLRWQNLKPVSEGVYAAVSHKWKCKDFMNEVVVSYHTQRDFSIYGFQVKHAEFFAEEQNDLPILLHFVQDAWEENMEVVNDHLLEQGFPAVEWVPGPEKGQKIVTIPSIYLMNTLFMSQVTLFIRLANTEKDYQSLNDMCNDPTNRQDRTNLDNCFKKPLKDFPAKLYDYLWYYNDNQHLKRDVPKSTTIQTSLMHNCGVVNWGWV